MRRGLPGRVDGDTRWTKARLRHTAVLAGVLAIAGLVAAPASARQSQIQMSAFGSAVAPGCPDGTPCTQRLTFDGRTSGTPSPFSGFPYYHQPVSVAGFLDVPVAASGSCGSGVRGVLEVLAARGQSPRERLAFEIVVNEATATCSPSGYSLAAAFHVDSTNTEDPAFRDAFGSGVLQLQGNSSVFSVDVDGTIETVR